MTTFDWRQSYPYIARIEGDLIYFFLLLLCVVISTILRKKASLAFRLRYDGIIGLFITLIVTKGVGVYSLVIVILHLLLFRCMDSPKALGNVSFYGTFAYLAFLRIAHFGGLPKLEFISNAIQLIMTLRVIGLSYEIADARVIRIKDNDKTNQCTNHAIIEPSTFEAFNYLYSFTGLFTGPYYTYKTYYDALHSEYLTNLPLSYLIIEKCRTLFWSFPLLLFFYWLEPVEILRSPQIQNYNCLTLIILCAFAFMYLRLRIYTAWMIAESICINGGIGIYPISAKSAPGIGPCDYEALIKDSGAFGTVYTADTIKNLDISQVESSDGFRSGMRAWNRTVQFWLANFVYKRTNKAFRMPYTMLVSAFWHGIHPGYFLSFLTIPLCTTAEDVIFKTFDRRSTTFQTTCVEFIWRCIRMRGFELMACAFLLLTWEDTVRLWNGLYWWLHFVMLGVLIIGHFKLHRKEKLPKIVD